MCAVREIAKKLDAPEANGVTTLDRRQIYLEEALDVSRVCSGAVRYLGPASSACVLVPGGTERAGRIGGHRNWRERGTNRVMDMAR